MNYTCEVHRVHPLLWRLYHIRGFGHKVNRGSTGLEALRRASSGHSDRLGAALEVESCGPTERGNIALMRAWLVLIVGTAAWCQQRPRAADLGIPAGTLARGPLDAITDVGGVRVGHTTLVRGDNIRTGVTVIVPHSGNLFREKVPGAVFIGNAFGKLAGSTQVQELGEIESPIA